ncbi:hypothetical protein UFOVP699_197 [uncultured Caudovirales phage]|uniref:Uncharacterized protein n=1 Tax=uncultured Caudovirales phage TaxID=2100421 RepID=A0A6J5NQ18_9CAUD|nr:hypothetical protein UFOVP699_197 [uncultured Caudovirales phage]
MKNQFYAYRIGIKWATIKDLNIKYTNRLDRASYWTSKKSALSWKQAIQAKYPLAELVELRLTLAD